MEDGCTVVLDIGKTNAKLTLWDRAGRCLARHVRENEIIEGAGYRALDAAGIEAWMAPVLADFARIAHVRAIVPVGHGAAAALVAGGRLFAPPMDYEDEGGEEERAAYLARRDAFEATGSPALPVGLNLGFQLHRLETLTGPWPDDLAILPWPQYWAWRFSGVTASEVTSLGCHSDLWRPWDGAPSALAQDAGWARRLPPLRRAGAVLGPVTAEWTALGLSADCQVLCGLHDSNAALLAARGHAEIAAEDATVLSTGTWFVALRSTGEQAAERTALDPRRDCLVNVDAFGRPTLSARFMGGREAEVICQAADIGPQAADLESARLVLEAGAALYPTFAPGVGPFPEDVGRWDRRPDDERQRRAAMELYLALMASEALDLIGSRGRLLVEGRFAEHEVFVRALAALRGGQKVYVSNAHDDVPYGALRLIAPDLPPPSPLVAVAPLPFALDSYARAWRAGLCV